MIGHYRMAGRIGLICAMALFTGTLTGQAQEPARSGNTNTAVKYNPPVRNAPAGRVGGSTRGTAESDLTVEVLAPDHVGLSSVDQPVLYWFLSRPVAKPLEISIDTVEVSSNGPLLEKTLDKSWPAGISGLSLRDTGVRLKPGVTYRWSVAVVFDPAQRSRDVIASGLIQHVRATARPAHADADADAAARISAGNGYWYDALADLSRDIDRRPGRRGQRADLLEQVGLATPAAFDRAAEPRS
jgi:hypothetical protein